MDYHDLSNTKTYKSWKEFIEINIKSICCLSSKGTDSYWDTNLNQYDFSVIWSNQSDCQMTLFQIIKQLLYL